MKNLAMIHKQPRERERNHRIRNKEKKEKGRRINLHFTIPIPIPNFQFLFQFQSGNNLKKTQLFPNTKLHLHLHRQIHPLLHSDTAARERSNALHKHSHVPPLYTCQLTTSPTPPPLFSDSPYPHTPDISTHTK